MFAACAHAAPRLLAPPIQTAPTRSTASRAIDVRILRGTYAQLPPRATYSITDGDGSELWSCVEAAAPRGTLPSDSDPCASARVVTASSMWLRVAYDDFDGTRREWSEPLEVPSDVTELALRLRFHERAPRLAIWLAAVRVERLRGGPPVDVYIDRDSMLRNESATTLVPQEGLLFLRAVERSRSDGAWQSLETRWTDGCGTVDLPTLEHLLPGEMLDLERSSWTASRLALRERQELRSTDLVRLRTRVGAIRTVGRWARDPRDPTPVATLLDVYDVSRALP